MQTIKDMRRFFLTFTLALFAVAASAGEKATKPSCAGFVSNRFWDNWEISAGFGINTAISNGDDFGKKAGFEGHIAATKWFHPIAGLRLQFEGGRFGNVDPEMGTMKWPYLYTHTDLTINASNWIGGYRDDRVYTAVPFVGFGYMVANFTDSFQQKFDAHTSHNYAFTYGLQNRFRISPSVNFDLEIKGLLLPSRICPAEMGGSYMFGFSATAGFTYRFNQRGWQRGVAGYTAEDIRAFQDAVAAGNAALEESGFLSQFVDKMYIIIRRDQFRAEEKLQKEVMANPKVEIIRDTVPVRVVGEDTVTGLVVKNVKTGEESQLDVAGVFPYIGQDPISGMVKDLGVCDEHGAIITNQEMMTKVPGVFAAGDVRVTELRQIVTATSDGAKAAESAFLWAKEHLVPTEELAEELEA